MKKSMIYTLLAIFVWTMAVPAAAQKKQQRSMKELDPEAAVEAVKRVIRKHQEGGGLNLIEKEIYPQFKKNPDVLTQIAHAFDFQANDTKNAFIYIDRALAVNPNYVPAFVEKGNILFNWAKTPEDSVEAYSWYDKAMMADPKNPEGYQAYANKLAKKHDYDGAAKKLEEILQHDPNYNVYVEIGRIYGGAEGLDYVSKAVDAYSKADMSRMTPNQIAGYITLLQAAGKVGEKGAYVRSDSLLTLALTKYPTDAKLNRLMMQNSVAIQKYDQAIAAADILFNKSDSAEISLDDFMSYAQAYEGLKNYNAAIEQYRKCVDFEILRENYNSDDAFNNAKRKEENQKNTAWQAIAEAYDASGYTDKAIEEQKKFIEYRREKGKLYVPELQQLIKFYERQAEISMGDEQKALYMSAYDIYAEIAEIVPSNAAYAYYLRLLMGIQRIDIGSKEGFAKPDAEKIVELLPLSSEITARQKSYLNLAVRYLISYYTHNYKGKDNLTKIGPYWKILGELDPTDNLYKVYDTKQYRKLMGFK